MTRLYLLFAIGVLASGCARSQTPASPAEGPETSSVTRWTARSELFAEYPPLVAGETSRFAIHLTRLDTFKPVTEGRVEVRLDGGGGPPETFTVEGPSRPGIFGVDVQPLRPGRRALTVVLTSPGFADEQRVGEVQVHEDVAAARTAAADSAEEPGISFLKEQQWSLDFATAVVTEQAVRESIRIPARLEPRPGGAADVAAPIDGRVAGVIQAAAGESVAKSQELARLIPPPSDPSDLPGLQRMRAEAATALAQATRDRERAERLTSAGAAPAKRLEDARSAEEQAQTRVAAAEASLVQYNDARSGSTTGDGAVFVVLAPLAGVIAHREAATGANVTAGTLLFRIVDTSHVHIVGRIPEAAVMRARTARSAEIESPVLPGRVPAGPIVSVGKVLDPHSRTLPITFVFDNRSLSLPVGQAVFLHLLMETSAPRAVVPVSAIVDDAGRPIVFVQREGETFERRAVTLGARAGDVVQVVEGVAAGDRVVTTGAFLVRLASLSTSMPAHGHVH